MLPTYVSNNGAIVVGPICIDGHSDKCLVRVVTHIHQDHIGGLEESSRQSRFIVATEITHELLEELGFSIPKRKRVSLRYGERKYLELNEDIVIRLEYAHHIPGSAQVVIEGDGVYAYTGDFKSVGTRTKPLSGVDVLVIDATYGDPSFKRPPEEVIFDEFVKLLKTLLSRGPVAIYAYYGKAQEVMAMLRDYGVDAPFIASSKHWRIAKRLEKYGFKIDELFLDGSKEANEIVRDGWFVKFEHFSKFRNYRNSVNNNIVSHIALSGWLFEVPIRSIGKNRWIVAFSDHADFDELIRYVDEARPRILVVDAARGGVIAKRFANYVRENLKIDAIASP